MEHDETAQARELHGTLEFIGLRAQATTVGLLQLCAELARLGVIDDAALERIKDAIFREIAVNQPRGYNRDEFEKTLRLRLNAIFPRGTEPALRSRVGTAAEMKTSLATGNGPQGQD